MQTVKKTNDTADREIVIERIINAPRALVFAAWTDQKHIGNWWGPNGFTTTTEIMDVRTGGKWKYIMKGPDGTIFPNLISYKKVIKNELLEYIHGVDESDPEHFSGTITFEDLGEKTKLTMRSVFKTAAERRKVIEEYGAIEGGNQNLDKFEKHLSNVEYK